MPTAASPFPDPGRADLTSIVLTRWETRSPAQQARLADQILNRYRTRTTPDELAGTYCFVSTRGDAVLSYQQWTGQSMGGPSRIGTTPTHPSGSQSTTTYIPYREAVDLPGRRPGGAVIVSFTFATPSAAAEWCDLLVDAVASQEEPTPGCISRHLAFSVDGRAVLNYSQWLDLEDHRRSLEAPSTTAQWRKVDRFDGIEHGPGARCLLHGAVTKQ